MRARLTVSIILVAWYLFLPCFGFTCCLGDHCGHVLYPLSHANVYHLLANILCLWMVRCPLHLLLSYACAVACSYIPCFVGEPTMGFSGMLFAMVGMSWGDTGRMREMLWRNKWFLIIPVFIPHVNALIHIYCMLAGYAVGYFGVSSKKSDWL